MAFVKIFFEIKKFGGDGSVPNFLACHVGDIIKCYLFPPTNGGWPSSSPRAKLDKECWGKENDLFFVKFNLNIYENEYPSLVCEEIKNKFMNLEPMGFYIDVQYGYFPKDILLSHYEEEIKEPSEDFYES